MAVRSVFCRGGAAWLGLVSSRKRSANRAAICSGARTRVCAAANGSGKPSSRRQMCATAAQLPAVSAKTGCTAVARFTNSRTDRLAAPIRELRGWHRAPRVATRAGHARRRPPVARGCGEDSQFRAVAQQRLGQVGANPYRVLAVVQHQLARARCRRLAICVSRSARRGASRAPSAEATACGTRAGSTSWANSASQAPSGFSARTASAMRSASQFPQTVAVLATGLGVHGVGRGALLNNVVGSAVTAVQPASERLVDASPRHGSDAGVVIMLAAVEPPKRSTVRPQSIASRATWLVVSEFDVDELYKELDCEATTGPMSLRTPLPG